MDTKTGAVRDAKGRWWCCWGHEIQIDNGYVSCGVDCNRGLCSICRKWCGEEGWPGDEPIPDQPHLEALICDDCRDARKFEL